MGKTTEGSVIDRFRELEKIRKRYDEYTRAGGAGYKAFIYNAHFDVGTLIDRVDGLEAEITRLREALGRIAATPLDIYPGEKSEIAQETLAGKPNPNPASSPALPRPTRNRT